MKFLIAGLGNPGAEYELTRHNIGFLVADRLADLTGATFSPDRYADHAVGKHKGRTLHIIKPNTYMNLSGKALNYWKQAENIALPNVMVVTDDLALPYGSMRMRQRGSDGGHNGLKSINELLRTQDYPRLRFGIGSDFPKGRQVDYVLGRWTDEEAKQLNELVEKAAQAVLTYATAGISQAMNQFNS